MKKILLIILTLALSIGLIACGEEPCTGHVDADGNGTCDLCNAAFECAHKDANSDLKCDDCNSPIPCTHKDLNNDGICDVEGCKWDYDHTHTYSPEWSHDEDMHWHAPSCSHNVEGKDAADHEDENEDGICDGCGWDYDHTHTFDTENWRYNDTHHWHAPTCDHDVYLGEEEHVEINGSCFICKAQLCDHEYDETLWSSDDSGHWHPTTCGHIVKDNLVPHNDGDGETEGDGICDTCGYDFAHEHRYDDEWSFNTFEHWHACLCHPTQNKDVESHLDENNDGICDTCEHQFCNHTFSDKYTSDAVGHWFVSSCGHDVIDGYSEHIDEISDGLCDVCAYQVCAHTYDEEWSYNELYHWHAANCGHDAKGDYEKHTDYDGNLICDRCENPYEDPNPIEPDIDEPAIETPPHYIGGKPKQ